MIHLENLWDNTASQRNFDKIAQAAIDAGQDPATGALRQVSIRFGTGTATWSASRDSATVVIPHGLGRDPVFAVASAVETPIGFVIFGKDATSLNVRGFYAPGTAISGSQNFMWLVVG